MKKLIALLLLLTISAFAMFSCVDENDDGQGGDENGSSDNGGANGDTNDNGDDIDDDLNIDPDGWTKL